MRCGITGIELIINLTKGIVEKKEAEDIEFQEYLAGKGINSKRGWQSLTPEVDPLGENNFISFRPGVLVGTIAPAANRTIVTTKSPRWKYLVNTVFGGFWGPELKFAGYDAVTLYGKSTTPVYLWINDDKIELRNAEHLWGEDTYRTQELIKKELRNDKVQIACIGPAGENRLYSATIQHGMSASASRGAGIIMGDKKLKAIAVCGTKSIKMAHPEKLYNFCKNIMKRTPKLKEFDDQYPYSASQMLSFILKYFNGTPVIAKGEDWGKIHTDFIKENVTRKIGCYNCGISCKSMIHYKGVKPFAVKCQSWFSYHLLSESDWGTSLDLYRICEGYGLDTHSFPDIVALAIDLFNKGYITKNDTDGITLSWGDVDSIKKIIKKIVYREGVGDVLANGVEAAAKCILGKEIINYSTNTIKSTEQIPADFYLPGPAIQAAVNERGDFTRSEGWLMTHFSKFMRKNDNPEDIEALYPGYKKDDFKTGYHPYRKISKQDYMDDGYYNYPEEVKKVFWDDNHSFEPTNTQLQEEIKLIAINENYYTMNDLSGVCSFWAGHLPYPPVSDKGKTTMGIQAEMIHYATGFDIDEGGLREICERVHNLIRAYNIRAGLRRADDCVPKKLFKTDPPPGSPFKKLKKEDFENWIDYYYKINKWEIESGIPTTERLLSLDLKYVKEDLENRGILL